MNINAQITELISNLEHESRMFGYSDDYQTCRAIDAVTTELRNTFKIETPPFEIIDEDKAPF